MTFLQLQDKRFLIFGVANKKSIAYQIAAVLLSENAIVDLEGFIEQQVYARSRVWGEQ